MSDTHAHAAYVRTEMLPEQSPPATQAGVIKWLRENLFSSWVNAILTIVSLYVIYWVISHISGWMLNGIWDAGSLSECREIRDATYGEGSNVACWAVLTDRWDQLMFGFYPPEFYWRPVLALILFLVAMSPVLYDTLPRKMLLFTAISPFILFWLLWGGTIWGPIAVAAGFVLGWAVMKFAAPAIGQLGGTIAAIVVPILYWLFVAGPLASAVGSILPIGIEFVPSDDFGGFMLAFVIGIAGIILSLPLGIVLALGRQSDLFIINKFSVIFIEVIRGVPADRVAVHRVAAAQLLPAAGDEFRPHAAGDHHGDAVLRGLYRRGRPRRSRGAAARPVRGRGQPRARLLAVDAAHHPAAGAEDLDPRHRLDLHRPVQGHHAGGLHRASRPGRPVERDPRRRRTGTGSTGNSSSSSGCASSSAASACPATRNGWSASFGPIIAKEV
jgi:hypothetical protein